MTLWRRRKYRRIHHLPARDCDQKSVPALKKGHALTQPMIRGPRQQFGHCGRVGCLRVRVGPCREPDALLRSLAGGRLPQWTDEGRVWATSSRQKSLTASRGVAIACLLKSAREWWRGCQPVEVENRPHNVNERTLWLAEREQDGTEQQ